MSDVRCLMCTQLITNPDFRVVLCQEDHPDIDIGPYCETCMGKIKICSGCQHPFPGDICKGSGTGDFYCPACFSSLTHCDHCNSIKSDSDLTQVGSSRVCSSCIKRYYFFCHAHQRYENKDVEVIKNSLLGLQRPGVFRTYKALCTEAFEQYKHRFKFKDIKQCHHCSVYFSDYDEGNGYCERCWESFYTCSDCGFKGPRVDTYRTYKKEGSTDSSRMKYLCNSCHKHYNNCAVCGYLVPKQESKLKKGFGETYTVCPTCPERKECTNCLKLHTDTCGTKGYCRNCSRSYETNLCTVCNQIQDHEGVCRSCNDRTIYNYSLKPSLKFNYLEGKEKRVEGIYFGFENEITFGSDKSSMYKALKSLYRAYDPSVLLAKSDGSISGNGFEIVSQPMTLKFFHKLNLAPLFHPEIEGSSSCGLHIHVARDHFVSDVHLYKVINFLRENTAFQKHIAGRDYTSYANKIEKKSSKYLKDSKAGRTERRSIVNLTNKATIEFRMFAGCTTEGQLRSRVEVLHALICFCKDVGIKDSLSVPLFMEYVEAHKTLYPEAVILVSKFNQ